MADRRVKQASVRLCKAFVSNFDWVLEILEKLSVGSCRDLCLLINQFFEDLTVMTLCFFSFFHYHVEKESATFAKAL